MTLDPETDKPDIKAILFDAGGVLNKATDRFIYDEAASIFGKDREAVVAAIHKFEQEFSKGKISEKELWTLVSKELGVDPAPVRIFGIWRTVYEREFTPIEDTLKLVERIRSAGYRTGILSNTEKPHVEICKSKGHFDGFDPLVLSCEVGMRKPAREIFQLALDRLGLPADQVAFTDDNENKMTGARELGMHTHVFTSSENFEKWLKGLGLEF
jgi:putative hydrolase of the HAD superfamily